MSSNALGTSSPVQQSGTSLARRSRKARVAGWLIAAGLTLPLITGPARAADAPPAAPPDATAAAQPTPNNADLLHTGLDQLHSNQYEEAEATLKRVNSATLSAADQQTYTDSLAQAHDGAVQRQAARAEFESGEDARTNHRPLEAVAHYNAVLNNRFADDGTRAKAQEQIALAQAEQNNNGTGGSSANNSAAAAAASAAAAQQAAQKAQYDQAVAEYRKGDWIAARRDFQASKDAGFKAPAFSKSPADYLADIDAGENKYMQDHKDADAKAAYDRGRDEYAKGNWTDARRDFNTANDLGYKPGLFQDSAQKYLDRLDAREHALTAAPPATPPAVVATSGNPSSGGSTGLTAGGSTALAAPMGGPVAAGPASSPGAAVTDGAAPTATTAAPAPAPAAGPDLSGIAQSERLTQEQKQFRARGLVDMAQTAYNENRKEEALQLYTQAADLDPANTAARDGRDRVAVELGRAPQAGTGALGQLAKSRQEEIQAIQFSFNAAIDDARQAIQVGDFAKAKDAVERARVARNTDVAVFTTGELSSFDQTITTTEQQLQVAQDQAAAAKSAQSAQQSQQEERDRLARIRQERESTIEQLITQARDDVNQGKYEEALGVIDQILANDPNNDYAVGVRNLVQDKAILQEQRGFRESYNINTERQYVNAEEKKIPYEDILRYPDNWPDISQARDDEVQSTQGVTKEEVAVRAQLEKHLPQVTFEPATFTDVMDFFRDVTGANIFVNWRALEQAGIDKNTLVTARLRDVKFSKALNTVLQEVGGTQAKLGYTIDEGVITVSTADDLAKNVVTRVYDINDLLVQIPNFNNAPQFNLQNQSQTGSGNGGTATPGTVQNSGTSGGGLFSGGTNQNQNNNNGQNGTNGLNSGPPQALVDQVTKLITDTVAPDSWRTAGGQIGAIQQLSGDLVVTQTPENQEALQGLLQQLREQRALEITVEARFLTVEKNYMEDVGLDFSAAFNIKNPNHFSPILVNDQTSGFTQAPATAAPDSIGGAAQGLTTAVTFLDDFQVNMLLRAVQATDNSTLVTAPRLTLFNGQTAFILVSTQQAYVSNLTPVVANGVVSFQPTIGLANTGVSLQVTATVSADHKYVTMTLEPQLSTLVKLVPFTFQTGSSSPISTSGNATVTVAPSATLEVPITQITLVQTTVRIPDGGTLLLGGQTIAGEVEREAGVPILDKIPFLKRLFDNQSTAKDEQVLLILVKPTIIVERETENKQFPLLSTKVNG